MAYSSTRTLISLHTYGEVCILFHQTALQWAYPSPLPITHPSLQQWEIGAGAGEGADD